VRQPLAQGRDDESDERAQLQRQAIPRVIDEVYRRGRRLDGVEHDGHALAEHEVDDLIGKTRTSPAPDSPATIAASIVLTLKRERNVTVASAVPD